MENTQICIRLKRQKQTFFFVCSPYEGIDIIKRKIISFFKGFEPSDIRLYMGQKLLDQKSNLHDQGIVNNTLIHFKLKKGNNGQWQQILELGV